MTQPQAPVYEFGAFRLDTGRRLLFGHGNQAVHVTPKAYDTLLHLIEHRGEVQTKEGLMKAVWPGRVVEENNLNQNIATLRKALGEGRNEHEFIVTVPGTGYCFVADVFIRSAPTESHAPGTASIAVLPFLPLVAEHRDPALELGMADTLIARLSSIQKLIVRPISSVRKYVDAMDLDSLNAGRALQVDSVLEGSIQRWGDAIRITVRLINVASGSAQWVDTFDEKFSDIFTVQDAIAKRVAEALALQLGQEDLQLLSRRYTENAEVYELYLKGRFHLFRLTPPEMLTAIGYFQRAVEMDPSYAPAHIGLANAHFRLPIAAGMRPTDHYPKAKDAAKKALEINDHLAEVHAILGWISFWYDWDWAGAEQHFLEAQRLDPSNTEGHLGYAHLLSNTGQHLKALAEVRRACELEPVNLLASALECQFLLHAGQADEALAKLEKVQALDPHFWLPQLYYSSVYFELGRFSEALAAAEEALKLSGGNPHARAAAACALVKLGQEPKAQSCLTDLLQLSTQRYVPPYLKALACNGLGETGQAIAWLERGIEERDPRMTFLNVEPKMKSLRVVPGFGKILRRVGF